MIGLMQLLTQPSHVVMRNAVSPGCHEDSSLMQIALIMLQVKKGVQHTKKQPTIIQNIINCQLTARQVCIRFHRLWINENFKIKTKQESDIKKKYIRKIKFYEIFMVFKLLKYGGIQLFLKVTKSLKTMTAVRTCLPNPMLRYVI